MMRKFVTALAVVGLLAIPAAASASPHRGIAAKFTCVSATFYIAKVNGTAGNLEYVSSVNRFKLENNATLLCANQSNNFNKAEFNIEGTSNCMTYAGTKSGPGYLYSKTCSNYASQQWTYISGPHLYNAYTGSGLWLDGPKLDGVPFMEKANSNDNDQFFSVETT